jgi:geranylgeranyl pyrophosphate synthase
VGEEDKLGKPVAGDIEQGKMSLATIFALKRAARAREVLSSKDTAKVRRLLRDTGSIEYAMARARRYSEEAKNAISLLPESRAKEALCNLADLAIEREK